VAEGRGEVLPDTPIQDVLPTSRPVRIAVVSLGLIGGSAALALRAAGHTVAGYARRESTRRLALERGAVDAAPATLAEAVAEAEVVLLAPPVLSMRELLAQVAPHLAPGAVVTDAASTKADVERWALALLPRGPRGARWVGSHPMAGKETAGLEHADGTLFRGRTWCVVPPRGADPDAVALVARLARDTGARTLEIDAAAHDRAVAAVSHLPFMAAAAMARSVIARDRFGEMAPIAGTGLRDMTRLASGDAVMHRDICLTNRDNVIDELERYVARLNEAIALLRRQPDPDAAAAADAAGEPGDVGSPAAQELGAYFADLKTARDAWLARR
jgi:prephenate dehydrogenase